MKTLITFLICGLATGGSAQQSLKTFTSTDGLFRFQYSDMLVNCMPQQTPSSAIKSDISTGSQPAASSSADSCMSQGSICGGMGNDESTAACFAYPKARFKDKPAFVAATFYVSEILSVKTEEVCLKGSPDWYVIKSEAETTTINHITFKLLNWRQLDKWGAIRACISNFSPWKMQSVRHPKCFFSCRV